MLFRSKEAGVTVNRGIPVDAYSRTDVPDIYAAGDVTESRDAVTGEQKIMALWPNAYLQGEAAGRHMAGKTEEQPVLIPMNAVTFFGYPVITAGAVGGDGMTAVSKDSANGFKKLYLKDGKLQGMALFGDVERAGLYTALIKDQIKIDNPDDLVSDNFGINWYDKQTRLKKML